MSTRAKIRKFFAGLESVLGGMMFFVMIFFIGINVFFWWFQGRKFAQLDEIVLGAYVWVTYLCLGTHYIDRSCVSVDFLVQIASPSVRKVLDVIRDAATFIIASVVCWYGTRLMMNSFDKYTAIIKIPYAYIELGLVIGTLTLLIKIILKYIPDPEEPQKAGEEEKA